MDPRFIKVLSDTTVIRTPTQNLATFGTTVITYHMITRPLYQSLDSNLAKEEAVVRRGTVKASRPQIVTPYFLSRTDGFGEEAQEFMRELIRRGMADDPGILYTYANEPSGMEIVAARPEDVAERIKKQIDLQSRPLEAVILGVDELWDVSLMKFIFELTNRSAPGNFRDFQRAGDLELTAGVPRDARRRIDEMLQQVAAGELDPATLHRQLEAWHVFEEYEDRFFEVLRRRR
jgi:hypothetical protein